MKDTIITIWMTSGITLVGAYYIPKDYWINFWLLPLCLFLLGDLIFQLIKNTQKSRETKE